MSWAPHRISSSESLADFRSDAIEGGEKAFYFYLLSVRLSLSLSITATLDLDQHFGSTTWWTFVGCSNPTPAGFAEGFEGLEPCSSISPSSMCEL